MINDKQSFYELYGKRIFDICISVPMVIILIPVWAIVSCLIVHESGRPIIFKQVRAGKGGAPFEIYKFRSMVKNASELGPTSTAENDARITKIGRFLRKTSLDELPQLFNVIKGNMSLVGFRPGIWTEEIDINLPRFKSKPGITGAAQVNGRSSLTIDLARKYEAEYVNNITLSNDLNILLKTVIVVLKGSGTN